jgi:two-component system NtrC family sensor kinase
MDFPLRLKLLICFLVVTLVGGALMFAAGSYLIGEQVVGEAQRRVTLGLSAARAVLDQRLSEAEADAAFIADWVGRRPVGPASASDNAFLEQLRVRAGYDFLMVVPADPRQPRAAAASGSVALRLTLASGRAVAGLAAIPLRRVFADRPDLLQRGAIETLDTPHAGRGASGPLAEGLILEAAAPVLRGAGKPTSLVYAGLLLNGDEALVDRIRRSVFAAGGAGPNGLEGTVTLFLRDVRIATNVLGKSGARAVGTRLSAQVFDTVLKRGADWVGEAFVVDQPYFAAYGPLRDLDGNVIGALYAGVPRERYDRLRGRSMAWLGLMASCALLVAFAMAIWLAGRMTRPLGKLTGAVSNIATGDLQVRLPEASGGQRDEIHRLTAAFNEMAAALQERDEELRRSHDVLTATAGELERWNQNYLETLGFITHELKNQVAAVRINLLALRDGYVGTVTDDQREAIADVLSTVDRTEDMILSYLNLSRLEKGELEVRARPVEVATDVVAPVMRDLQGRFDQRRIRVQVELAPDLVVQADPSLLQMVFANLLSNAAKYGAEGGLVRVFGQRLNGSIEFHVWNEGAGVAEDQRDELFRKFSRLEPPGEQQRGTGLGLFITREIVRKHGGEIRAESQLGRWIDFVFTVPRPDVLLGDDPSDAVPEPEPSPAPSTDATAGPV